MALMASHAYGAIIPTPEWPDSASEAISALSSSRAPFGLCAECFRSSLGTYGTHSETLARRVTILSAGALGGDILDKSNAHALSEAGAAWGPDAYVHHNGATVSICVDPAEVNPDALADMIHVAELFAEYPVLDESDYSERELREFEECFALESSALGTARGSEIDYDSQHPAWREATGRAMEYLGHSDPGYISPENVAACWDAALNAPAAH
jgi:hypothetical protein